MHMNMKQRQQGSMLVELMVGIVIGLMVIAAAIGTLMYSRSMAGVVTEKAGLQQQASFVLNIIGQQIRPAGAYELINATATDAFTFDAFPGAGVIINATNNRLEVVTQAPNATLTPAIRTDCTGQPVPAGAATVSATFARDAATNSLTCNGTALTGNVTDFRFRFRNATSSAGTNFTLANTPNAFTRAVEVCIEMTGTENIDTGGAQYVNCQGNTVTMEDRMRVVLRNVFDVRVRS